MNTTNDFRLRDVTLRDGLQLTGGMLSTERKAGIVRSLLAAGVPAVEIGSMARPDLVPSMANTLELISVLTAEELEKCWIWVATPRHVERAAAAGAVNMQYCLSVSDAHNQANIGRSREASMAALPQTLEHAREAGATLQLCLATSFTCPFEGDIDPDRVLKLVEDPRGEGVSDVVICDTLGHAVPDQVNALIREVRAAVPDLGVVFHGHDTWGMGVANAIAALDAGATTIDGALGGLGGCPFAPGASGNTSTEDLLFGLRPDWLNPENFADLVRLGESITSELQEDNRSKSAMGARSKAATFQWVISS
ncbi:hydroxymethylglutaryl-CoA lyase [Pseudarthrobacter sp. NIBRBAC000502770]|uniref:hydroxymethylglutaryl-CoA lyase n=1 Tax=Pseudarthrobacter sp. NIBRBAC000502770 TaxID=2590785 RepID=UPI0011404144|nr:hydroxymethylglutaryl-CoA lyase [Pseudarthrobacter sp. NIBRBAC000502770]QDG88185.1 hydroxymethylglutaryl-CoA lyase [Pseudarthrobacter sp. NIBRBAC000502770]